MDNFGFSMLWYWAAYLIVTAIGVLHTIFQYCSIAYEIYEKQSWYGGRVRKNKTMASPL